VTAVIFFSTMTIYDYNNYDYMIMEAAASRGSVCVMPASIHDGNILFPSTYYSSQPAAKLCGVDSRVCPVCQCGLPGCSEYAALFYITGREGLAGDTEHSSASQTQGDAVSSQQVWAGSEVYLSAQVVALIGSVALDRNASELRKFLRL
jgi:hypothetical protein